MTFEETFHDLTLCTSVLQHPIKGRAWRCNAYAAPPSSKSAFVSRQILFGSLSLTERLNEQAWKCDLLLFPPYPNSPQGWLSQHQQNKAGSDPHTTWLSLKIASERGGQMDRGHHSTPTPANYAPSSSEIHSTLQSGAAVCVQGFADIFWVFFMLWLGMKIIPCTQVIALAIANNGFHATWCPTL